MARRATSLGPKPSLFVLAVFVFFFVYFSFCLGGFLLLSIFGLFPWWFLEEQCFPPKKMGNFCLFSSVSLCLCLAFFPPPFSLSLSLSLSCYFLSFFLPSFLCCCILLPCFCLFFISLVSLFYFLKRTTSEYPIRKFVQRACEVFTCSKFASFQASLSGPSCFCLRACF